MITHKSKSGPIGEEAAVSYLTGLGYTILQRNYRNFIGEIDIVAVDDDTLCFIEVKTRNDDQLGSPLEAVTSAKRKKITRVATGYIQTNNAFDHNIRFDVVAVWLDGDQCQNIEVIKNAFEAQ